MGKSGYLSMVNIYFAIWSYFDIIYFLFRSICLISDKIWRWSSWWWLFLKRIQGYWSATESPIVEWVFLDHFHRILRWIYYFILWRKWSSWLYFLIWCSITYWMIFYMSIHNIRTFSFESYWLVLKKGFIGFSRKSD